MREKDIVALFTRLNVLRFDGHYAYTSDGRHGSTYVDKDALYCHSDETMMVWKK